MVGSELRSTWRYFTSCEVVPSLRLVLKLKVVGIVVVAETERVAKNRARVNKAMIESLNTVLDVICFTIDLFQLPRVRDYRREHRRLCH